MTAYGYKDLYQRFLSGHEGLLHFSAHSHHFWPDVSRDGHIQYWDDCALRSDRKWEKLFSEVIPKAQAHICGLLNLKNPEQIAFAPNTHELTARLLSLFTDRRELNILTSAHEFHSWNRQITRLEENAGFKVRRVTGTDLVHNKRAFIDELKTELKSPTEIFFISQVFFDSGIALTSLELKELREACPKETLMVVDGYHAFAALPVDLSELEGGIFYLGGGYKYAQAGEGVGFMVIPSGHWRPAYTGWFAEYEGLSKASGEKVAYAEDGLAFMGATQDLSGLYRLNAVWDHFSAKSLGLVQIHEYVRQLQHQFLSELPASFTQAHNFKPLFDSHLKYHGHFLTFEALDIKSAAAFEEKLKAADVLIDRRGPRLRFGFGLYQDAEDVTALVKILKYLA
jgi:selenocysteine lyase/cysteine desulfurase